MSRFSKAEAESLGWVFVLEQKAYTEPLGTFKFREHPGRVIAEKSLTGEQSGVSLREEDETVGKVLERIFEYERKQGILAGESEDFDPTVGAAPGESTVSNTEFHTGAEPLSTSPENRDVTQDVVEEAPERDTTERDEFRAQLIADVNAESLGEKPEDGLVGWPDFSIERDTGASEADEDEHDAWEAAGSPPVYVKEIVPVDDEDAEPAVAEQAADEPNPPQGEGEGAGEPADEGEEPDAEPSA